MIDPRLDRLPEFDERSRNYPVRALISAPRQRSYTWSCNTFLDQGREGACVGFAIAHEFAARPVSVPVTNIDARDLYHRARELDQWPGEDYEGTSVLGGMRAALETQYITEYRWAFGIDDLIWAIGHKGPAILGINWHEGMIEPDRRGWIRPTGAVVGGHAILARGVNLARNYIYLHNSWGSDWGSKGMCRIAIDDLGELLDNDGEAAIPIKRGWGH